MTGGLFAEWIGRSVETRDRVTEGPLRRLAATLDHDGGHWPAGVLPPLGHWLFHLPEAPQSTLGADGHPTLGAFLPPIQQPRRMWAGGRVRFFAPVAIGAEVVKRTTITAIEEKRGAAGAMTFVTLRHDLLVAGGAAIVEEQDLVYLPVVAPLPAKVADRAAADSMRHMVADEALLFRFSALTFNAHRIHYDLTHTRLVELYPTLVVHGPLQAMLLIDHAMRDGIVPARFDFRARAPLYAGRGFTLARSGQGLSVQDDAGAITMTASFA